GRGGMGNMSEAWRLLWNAGKLCAKCRERYSYDMRRDKSYVPRTFRRQATPNKLELAKARGWKHARDIGPHIGRIWRDENAGDWFTFDDETPNHRVYDRLPNGQFITGRIQNIEAIDAFSDYPLEILLYFGAPTALAISRLIARIFLSRMLGMPHKGVLL